MPPPRWLLNDVIDGVATCRYCQLRHDVVRIVLDLDGPKEYQVEHKGQQVRVTFGSDAGFKAWSSAVAHKELVDEDEPAPAAPTVLSRKAEVTVPFNRAVAVGRAEPASPSPGTRPTSPTWCRASRPFPAAPSSWARASRRGHRGDLDKPWCEAFHAILAAQGLSAQEMPGGIIRVDDPTTLAEIDSLEPLETQVLRVNYARVSELGKSIEGILTKNRGKVNADTASNSLIITDTKSRVTSIMDFARGLDIRTPQVSIQAKIIFVDRTDLEQLGVKYDLGSQQPVLQQAGAASRSGGEPGDVYPSNVNVVDLGGNAVVRDRQRELRHPALRDRPRVLDRAGRVSRSPRS